MKKLGCRNSCKKSLKKALSPNLKRAKAKILLKSAMEKKWSLTKMSNKSSRKMEKT